MNEFYSVVIDRNSENPIYKQLGDKLCELIEKGVIPTDTRLPAIRKMAEKLKVNNATVVMAYKYMETKKIVYSIKGSGTYVSPIPVEKIPEPVEKLNINFNESYDFKNKINFTSSSIPEELFPTDDFKQVFNTILEREKGNAFKDILGQGYEPLRNEIALFCENLGIRTNKENIQIISGAQQGIDIVSKALMKYKDCVIVEKPTFYGAVAAFISRGSEIIEIPLEYDGINIEMLENTIKLYKPKIMYIMAYFQTPSGICYSTEKKLKIIEIAEKNDIYIIEDDNLYDFNYTGESIVPLKALDYKNRVIYIKSFSKILMPGLRTGFMIIPPKIKDDVIRAKYTSDISTSGFMQRAVYEYLKNYDFKNHINNIIKYAENKYYKALSCCKKYLDKEKIEVIDNKGGISLWIKLKTNINLEQFCGELIKNGVIVALENQFINSGKGNHIRLCFVNLSDEDIEKGFRIMGNVIKKY